MNSETDHADVEGSARAGSESLELARLVEDARSSADADEARAIENEIARRAADRLVSLALRLCGRRASEADDLLQDAWVGRLRKIIGLGGPAFRNSRDFLRVAARALRQTRVDSLRGDPKPVPGVSAPVELEEHAEDTDVSIDIRTALSRLTDEERSVVEAMLLEGRSREETAMLLGVSPARVRTIFKRAGSSLRRQLVEYRSSEANVSGGESDEI